MNLRDSQFLFLDGQTTGLSPRNAELIELGWSPSFDEKQIQTRLLKPDDLASVPRVVWQMTGLDPKDFHDGAEAKETWQSILDCRKVRAAVIHYSQFEVPFLQSLHKTVAGEEAELPWPVICTYKVAKRLYDNLPARSIRALSGHFGLVLPETHRAQNHVAATQRIWKNLIETLETREGVKTWEEFLQWWETPAPKASKTKKVARKYLVDRMKRLELPAGPGVYEMLSSTGQILYIGKATSLHSRVNSYFRQRKTTRTKLKELMTQVADVRVTPTETALEAALLENDRIKEIDPPYNFSLREHARRLLFVSPCLTHFSETRDGEHPWGPFTSHEIFESLERLLCIQQGRHDLLDPLLLNYPPEVTKQKLDHYLDSIGIVDKSELSLRDLLHAGRNTPAEGEETEDEEKQAEASVYRKLRRARERLHQAHWLAWLTESRICWEVPERGFRVLTIRGGKVAETELQKTAPDPLTYLHPRVPLRDRQKRLDLATYDRMRILGTEISTLAKKGTAVTVQLSTHRFFRGEQLP